MKKIATLLLASFGLLLLSRCRPDGGTLRGYFWTSRQRGGPYYLYINDTLKGTLPSFSHPPECGEAGLEQKTLFILLRSGVHVITVKDQQGNQMLSERYKLYKGKGSLSLSVSMDSPQGSNRHVISGDCSVEEISF